MTVLDIYNLALSVFKEPPVTEVELKSKSGHSIEVLSLFYQPALLKARDEYSWSWLEEIIELSELNSYLVGYKYAYELPQGQIKITEVLPREVEYRKIGNKIYSKDLIYSVIGIRTETITPDNPNIPDEFWILVAYAMAFLASESLKAIRSYLEANPSLRSIATGIWVLATTPEILKCIQMEVHLTLLKILPGSGITSIMTLMKQTLKPPLGTL